MSRLSVYFFILFKFHGHVSLLLFYPLIISCESDHRLEKPLAQKGILDLQNWNLQESGFLECNGEWEFYWQKLYTPQDFQSGLAPPDDYLAVPGIWNDFEVDGKSVGGFGYGTYHLRVLLDQVYQELAVKIQNAGTALKLYVNDSLIMTQGKVGLNKADSESEYRPQIVVFQPNRKFLDLVIQVSNFDYRKGGLWHHVDIGTSYNIFKQHEHENMVDIFLLGTFIIIGLYHIILYFIRPKEKASLFFGLFCLITCLRVLTIDNILLLRFVDIPWPWLVTLEYLSFYCGSILFVLFIHKLFPRYTHPKVIRSFTIISLGFALLVLLSPVGIFNLSLSVFEILTISIVLYIVHAIYRELRKGKTTALIFLGGFLVFTATFINDILHNAKVIDSNNLIAFGLYIFILCQSLLLAIHFSSGFNKSEKLSKILDNTNKNLEKLVSSRTESLVIAKNELEKKHKQITDSINYALRIQMAILPSHVQIKEALPESLIFFQPRDVVSGDFYWIRKRNNKIFIALIDCTGHGVPGAFMSFLAYGFLNEAIDKKRLDEPCEISKVILKGIKNIMNDGQKYYADYVDMGLCVIDSDTQELHFNSSRRPLIAIQNEADGQKKIAMFSSRLQPKVKFHFQLSGNTNFYLFSDGYTDQFGGRENKKFGIKNLKNLLLRISDKPMQAQYKIIKDNINQWKKTEKQIDDILVIGFRT